MILATIVYNLIVAAVGVTAGIVSWRKRNLGTWRRATLVTAVVALLLARLFGVHPFRVFYFAAFGLFLHGTLWLIASTVVLWRQNRALAIGCAISAVTLSGVAYDAFLVEPTWLEVTRLEIASDRIGQPLRIVVVADLQTDRIGPYERDVLRRAVAEGPDLLLLAGDYIQAEPARRRELYAELNASLKELDLPGPDRVFAVGGNVDMEDWPTMFDGLPVVAVTETRSFDVAALRLTCLTMGDSRRADLRVGRGDSGPIGGAKDPGDHSPGSPGSGDDSQRFHVVMGHCPDYALGEVDADLLIAGHTHGGQVRLPLVGPLMTLSAVPRSWAAGLTELPGRGRLLVSRGVGMERGDAPRLRFLCRPELVVIDLVPKPR